MKYFVTCIVALTFLIVSNIQAQITLIQPNGGEEIVRGHDYTVKWTGAPVGSAISLYYSSDKGQHWINIAQGLNGTEYEWQSIPLMAGDNYLMSVSTDYLPGSEPDLNWQLRIGGSEHDYLKGISPTADGNYLVVGYTQSNDGDIDDNHGGTDILVVKLAPDGQILWKNTFGGSGSEQGHDIIQARDGGYLVLGHSNSNDGDFQNNNGGIDVCLLKLNSSGELEWTKNYGGSSMELADCIIMSPEGGYLIAGGTMSNDEDVSELLGGMDCWAVKISENGNLQWEKCYGGSLDERFTSVVATADNNYIFNAHTLSNDIQVTNNNGALDIWVVKTSEEGEFIWGKCFGSNGIDAASKIIVDDNNNYLIAGSIKSSINSSLDYYLVKLNESGNVISTDTYGGSADDVLSSIIQTSDGGYALLGYSESDDGDKNESFGSDDYWLIKLSPELDITWESSYGGSSGDKGFSLLETGNKGLCIAGATSSDNGQTGPGKGGSDMWIACLTHDGSEPVKTDQSDAPWSVLPITVEATNIDAGDVFAGYETTIILEDYLSNPGPVKARVDSIRFYGKHGSYFNLLDGYIPVTIPAGSCTNIGFSVNPDSVETLQATIYIYSEADNQFKNVTANAIDCPVSSVVDSSIFQDVRTNNDFTANPFLLKNDSGADITLDSVRLSGDPEFVITDNTNGVLIESDALYMPTIVFHPTEIRKYSSTVSFYYSGLKIPFDAILVGYAIEDTISVKETDNSIEIYPNPANKYLTVELPNEYDIHSIDISIIDMMGRPAPSSVKLSNSGRALINVSELAPGVYSIVLKTGHYVKRKQFIIR